MWASSITIQLMMPSVCTGHYNTQIMDGVQGISLIMEGVQGITLIMAGHTGHYTTNGWCTYRCYTQMLTALHKT